MSEPKRKKVTFSRETEYDLTPEQREQLKKALREITGAPATGEVTVQLGQGGVSSVRLVERDN